MDTCILLSPSRSTLHIAVITVIIASHEGVGSLKLNFRIDAFDHSQVSHAVYVVADVCETCLFTSFTDGTEGHLKLHVVSTFPAFLILLGLLQRAPAKV